MDKIIKKEWIRRIKENPTSSPSFLLNKLYEEVMDVSLSLPNRYRLRSGRVTILKEIPISTNDPIRSEVAKWAGLDSVQPRFITYHEKGGVGIESKKNHSIEMVHRCGGFRDDQGMPVKATVAIEKYCELIESDL